jgi:hypothetical protein
MARNLQSLAELTERAEQVRRDFADEVAVSERLKVKATMLIGRLQNGLADLIEIERRSDRALSNSSNRSAKLTRIVGGHLPIAVPRASVAAPVCLTENRRTHAGKARALP